MKHLFDKTGSTISVRNLHKAYRAGEATFTALRGLTFDISARKVTVVQGPSGCGKTTLMNILGGVDFADSGQVLNGSFDVTNQRDERTLARYRLQDVGFVFQNFNLIPGLNVLDNLQLPMAVAGVADDVRAHRALQLLDLVGMSEKARKRPEAISGGEQQRVAIALALVNDPPLILADEPTGNLDSKNTMTVVNLLASLAHDWGKTVVVSTHDPMVGSGADQAVHMRDGLFESTSANPASSSSYQAPARRP